jgi:sugar phosphate isomerase/epimerase
VAVIIEQGGLGASTSCLGKGIEESILRLREFEVIELGANHCYEEGAVETVERLREGYDLALLLHGCFPPLREWFILNPASQEEETLTETRRLILAMIDLARRWEVPLVSVHPGFTAYPTRPRGEDPGSPDVPYPLALRTAQESFRLFLEAAQGDVEVIAENLPYEPATMMRNPEEIAEFVEGLGMGLLLDVGHFHVSACQMGFDFARGVKAVAKYARELHLHDNDGGADEHLPLGEGTIDFGLLQGVTDAVPVLEAYGGLEDLRRSAERWRRRSGDLAEHRTRRRSGDLAEQWNGGGRETLPNGGKERT